MLDTKENQPWVQPGLTQLYFAAANWRTRWFGPSRPGPAMANVILQITLNERKRRWAKQQEYIYIYILHIYHIYIYVLDNNNNNDDDDDDKHTHTYTHICIYIYKLLLDCCEILTAGMNDCYIEPEADLSVEDWKIVRWKPQGFHRFVSEFITWGLPWNDENMCRRIVMIAPRKFLLRSGYVAYGLSRRPFMALHWAHVPFSRFPVDPFFSALAGAWFRSTSLPCAA